MRIHKEHGAHQTLTELYLIGETSALDKEVIAALPDVERVVRISQEYRIIGRHMGDQRPTGFEHNGVRFARTRLTFSPALCRR